MIGSRNKQGSKKLPNQNLMKKIKMINRLISEHDTIAKFVTFIVSVKIEIRKNGRLPI